MDSPTSPSYSPVGDIFNEQDESLIQLKVIYIIIFLKIKTILILYFFPSH